MNRIQSRNTARERILAVALLWAIGAVLLFFELGVFPRSPVGWLIFLVLGPPLYLAAEILGESLPSLLNRVPVISYINAKIAAATADRRFSVVRVFYALIATLVFIAVVGAMVLAVNRVAGEQLDPIKAFLALHFRAA